MAASFVSLLLLAVSISGARVTAHSCAHGLYPNELVTGVRLSPAVARRQTASQGMRIFVHYDTSVESASNQAVKDAIQNTYIPGVTDFLQSTLRVRSEVSPIRLDRTCTTNDFYLPTDTSPQTRHCFEQCATTSMCGTVAIPEDHLRLCVECNGGDFSDCEIRSGSTDGPGVADYDYILYVSANQDACNIGGQNSLQLLAFAAACQMESSLDRPIAGFVNFCPDGLADRDDKFAFSVTKHEILHAVAISRQLFPFWRNSDGTPRTPRDSDGRPPIENGFFMWDSNTIQDVTYDDWDTRSGPVSHDVSILVTETVRAVARNHYGCPSLLGAELENQGGDATALNHWEQRVFGNEAMTGQILFNPGFSRITFAALQDSGWYDVDYTLVDDLLWGRGQGCDFAQRNCLSYINEQNDNDDSISPFCDEEQGGSIPLRLGCTLDHLAVSQCNLVSQGSIPQEYRYFSDRNLGGAVTTADYCPFQQEFQYTDGRTTECSETGNMLGANQNFLLESYSEESRCFEHGREWELSAGSQLFQPTYGGGCYQFECTSEGGGVTVYVGGEGFNCSCAGEEVVLDLTVSSGVRYEGSIICPACSEICHDQRNLCPYIEPLACPGRVTMKNETTVIDVPGVTAIPTTTAPGTPPSSATSIVTHWTALFVVALVTLFA